MAAEGDDFTDSMNYFNHLIEHSQWKKLGSVTAGGNLEIGDISEKPELAEDI